jgi:hypothetical protein
MRTSRVKLPQSSEGKRDTRFKKGNKLGNRFKPGQTGNPGGSSKLQCLTAELRAQLPKLSKKLIARALKRAHKNDHSLAMLWDRAEGPLQREVDNSIKQISVIVLPGSITPSKDNARTDS